VGGGSDPGDANVTTPASSPTAARVPFRGPRLLREVIRAVVYDTIIVLAVLLALDPGDTTQAEAFFAVLFAALAASMGEVYASLLGTAIASGRRPNRSDLEEIGIHLGAVVIAILAPTACLILCALGVWSVEVALDVAYGILVGAIFTVSYAACRLTGSGRAISVALAGGLLVVGLLLVALKVTGH
jgi:hypothetical protein